MGSNQMRFDDRCVSESSANLVTIPDGKSDRRLSIGMRSIRCRVGSDIAVNGEGPAHRRTSVGGHHTIDLRLMERKARRIYDERSEDWVFALSFEMNGGKIKELFTKEVEIY